MRRGVVRAGGAILSRYCDEAHQKRDRKRKVCWKKQWASARHWRSEVGWRHRSQELVGRARAVEAYRVWNATLPRLSARPPELRGKTLGSWCEPEGSLLGNLDRRLVCSVLAHRTRSLPRHLKYQRRARTHVGYRR